MTALDTNVFIYSCDKADPRRQQLALDLIEASSDGVLLWQVACEFVAASRKLSRQGFTLQDAWYRLDDFLDLFPLVLPSHDTLKHARALTMGEQSSFWDSMIVAACLDCGVQTPYSEDLPGRRPPVSLRIINPFAQP